MSRSCLLAFLLALASTSEASTQDCVDAHVRAQTLRAQAQLVEAREELARCGAPECPGVLREECATWLSEVEVEVPSLVFVVVTAEGKDARGVELRLDALSESLSEGVSVTVNPGKHTVRASAPGFQSTTVEFTARSGERQRRIELTLEPLESSATLDRSAALESSAPIWPYFALGGGVVLGSGVLAGFGVAARDGEGALAECAPDCARSAISEVKAEYVAANVGLAVASASLVGIGVYFVLSRSTVSVSPAANGAGVRFTHSF